MIRLVMILALFGLGACAGGGQAYDPYAQDCTTFCNGHIVQYSF